jgi:REP element-mobilizing transposase RayT
MQQGEIFYRRHLPHYFLPDANYFVTFRLYGSLPRSVIEQMKRARIEFEQTILTSATKNKTQELARIFSWEQFQKYDKLLEMKTDCALWLRKAKIAELVKDAIHYRNKKAYELHAFCIMPNHVHMIIRHKTRSEKPNSNLATIIGNLKWYTALQCNKVLRRTGSFWQAETYDHIIRDDMQYERLISYVLNNPVKARLVES